jgi:periplasmic protein TonB
MVHGPGSEERSVSLNGCLLEGDSEVERRARRGKQRAILVSIVLQVLIVAALLLIPLLGKSESIAGRLFVPTVPYAPGGHLHQTTERHAANTNRNVCRFCPPLHIPTVIVSHDARPPAGDEVVDDSDVARFGSSDPGPGVPFAEPTHGPKPPEEREAEVRPKPLRISKPVEAATLIHRVEPIYPPLARQTRREGRVELHAIIATDGTIQSLEVISGDPFFLQSALGAVREWRYRPTILNGQPVEVDTHITVIYTLAH